MSRTFEKKIGVSMSRDQPPSVKLDVFECMAPGSISTKKKLDMSYILITLLLMMTNVEQAFIKDNTIMIGK